MTKITAGKERVNLLEKFIYLKVQGLTVNTVYCRIEKGLSDNHKILWQHIIPSSNFPTLKYCFATFQV